MQKTTKRIIQQVRKALKVRSLVDCTGATITDITMKDIAEYFDLSVSTIKRIKKGELK